MEFIRQNMTLIIVAAVFLAVAGLLLIVDVVVSGKIDAAIAEREGLSQQLQSLSRNGINRKMKEAEKLRVETIKAAQQRVIEQSTEWNRLRFRDMILSATDSRSGSPQTVYAFPYDPEVYNWSSLRLDLSQNYVDRMDALLAELVPAEPASAEEVEKEFPIAKGKLMLSDEYKMMSPDDMRLNERAQQYAMETVRQEKAFGKLIYADQSSLEYVLRTGTPDVLPPLLWRAQMNLWVTADVVAAIREANEAAIAQARAEHNQAVAAGGEEGDEEAAEFTPSVAHAAVRALVKLSVHGYSLPGEAQPTGPMRAGRNQQASGRATLTQRRSNTLYDVVFYSVTVIMPMRHLDTFQQALMRQNYHTIMDIRIEAIDADKFNSHRGYYYFGPDPVVKVTLRGELLLLASWVRGTWDPDAGVWLTDLPPLMPVETVRDLPPEAVRPEDRDHRR